MEEETFSGPHRKESGAEAVGKEHAKNKFFKTEVLLRLGQKYVVYCYSKVSSGAWQGGWSGARGTQAA